jgi:UDP-N-acetylmuramoyl-tripeptide--D-alanyl-D-alanine ligase
MYPMSLERLAAGLGGRVLAEGGQGQYRSLSTDTRNLEAGQIYLALKGPNFDGQAFFTQALAKGASALVGSRFSAGVVKLARRRRAALLKVKDGLQALQSLAADQRGLMRGPVACVSGSTGKTGTKDRLAHLLSGQAKVLATEGNLNNAIGLPLTLLKAEPDQAYAVLEAGMNRAGELRALARLARPDLAVLTNVGDAHLGHFKDRKAVAAAKAELIESLGPGHTAVLNGDDSLVRPMARRHRGPSILFGRSADCHLRLLSERDRGASGLGARLTWNPAKGRKPVAMSWKLPQGGRASLWNGLAAAAAGLGLGLDPDEVASRLASFQGSGGFRMEMAKLGKARAVLDCYNASPQSMEASLEFLSRSAPQGRRLAVLGDMLELGPSSEKLHLQAGKQARKAGLRVLAGLGNFAPELCRGFGGPSRAFPPGAQAEAASWLAEQLKDGDWILFKGSHGMQVQKVFQSLKESLA